MNGDDTPIGQLLTRREMLTVLGASGAAWAAGASILRHGASSGPRPFPGCVARPAQTEGPYFVDERLNRSDIRSDPGSGTVSAGVPLALTFLVSRLSAGQCAPLGGAVVDVWHCDADGIYSDVTDPSFTTVGKKFLRGYQVTDAAGQAVFRTIYPGWYAGRTVHVHFKVRTPAGGTKAAEFTSQVYFDDAFTDRVYTRPPYAARGQRSVRNRADGIFRSGGEDLIVAPTEAGDGYAATFSLGLLLD